MGGLAGYLSIGGSFRCGHTVVARSGTARSGASRTGSGIAITVFDECGSGSDPLTICGSLELDRSVNGRESDQSGADAGSGNGGGLGVTELAGAGATRSEGHVSSAGGGADEAGARSTRTTRERDRARSSTTRNAFCWRYQARSSTNATRQSAIAANSVAAAAPVAPRQTTSAKTALARICSVSMAHFSIG